MTRTVLLRLLALSATIVVLCCFTAFGEDAGRVRIVFDDYKDPSLLLRNYVELSKSSPASGDVDADSYLVKGMMYCLLDAVHQDCKKSGNPDLETFQTFQAKYSAVLQPFAGLREISPDSDNVLKAILAAGMLGYFFHGSEDRTKEARLAREYADSLLAVPDLDKASRLLRLSCGLLHGTGPMAFLTTTIARREGPSATFVLNNFSVSRVLPKRADGRQLDHSIDHLGASPLTAKPWSAEEMGGKAKVQGVFHPYAVFTMTAPSSLVDSYIPDEGSEGWDRQRGSWVPVDTCARGPLLLHSYYCWKAKHESNPPCAADIEGVFVDEELPMSASIQGDEPGRETRGSFYQLVMMRADHLERPAPWSGPSSSQREKANSKYSERLMACRPYLAARYPKTVLTSVTMDKNELGKATMEYLTPDYSCKPEFFVAMVPDEWIRIACYCGLEMVADFNILGLDDPRPIRPKRK